MSANQQPNKNHVAGENLPWYRQFWPWFIIALPASAVIASFVTLWLAITHPDPLVVDEDEYTVLRSELKAQVTVQKNKEDETDKSLPRSN